MATKPKSRPGRIRVKASSGDPAIDAILDDFARADHDRRTRRSSPRNTQHTQYIAHDPIDYDMDDPWLECFDAIHYGSD